MEDWQKELSQFLTGEAYVADADTWYLKHKDFIQPTGYNILGQYQGNDGYPYFVWVEVVAPEDYGITEAKIEVMRIINDHRGYFNKITPLKTYDDNFRSGVLFAAESEDAASAGCEKIKALAPAGGGGGDDILKKKIILGVMAGIILIAVLALIFKK